MYDAYKDLPKLLKAYTKLHLNETLAIDVRERDQKSDNKWNKIKEKKTHTHEESIHVGFANRETMGHVFRKKYISFIYKFIMETSSLFLFPNLH